MKKLFTMLILLFLWAVSSWGQSVIIGTGTTTTNGSTLDPVERYYNYEHYQIIYTAAELSAAGLPSGAIINSLGFSISESAVSLANYTISMGLTAQATAQPYISTLTTVKNAFTYAPVVQAAGSFDMIPFDVNFTWDGSSNIVVNTCTGSNPFTSPYGGLRYSAGVSGIITYVRTDGTDNCASTTLASTTYKPNIQFNYTPGGACSGTPAPGNTISSANPVCSGVSFSLSLQNSTPGSGVTYQWQTSPNGSTWTNVGTSVASLSTSQTVATYYRCQVTCSGNTGTSNALLVTMNPFLNCYCTSGATSTGDEEITTVAFGSTLNNTSACASLTGTQGTATGTADLYSNFTSIAATNVERSLTLPITVTITECAGTAYSHDVRVYFDFNQNGSLSDAGEEFIIWAYASSLTHTITASIPVPATATLGNTLMRVVCKESSTTGPCLQSSYGETEDYLVNIVVPTSPAISVTPTTLTFATTVSGGTSAELSYSLSALNLSPATGSITITPPANFAVSLTSGGPYSSVPITKGYTGGALASTPVYAVFKPTAPSTTYTGVIANSGGTAPTVNVAVSGISACGAITTFPYTQNFDAVTAPAIPNCWLVTDDNADLTKWVTSTLVPRSAPNSMRIGYNSAAAMNDWFFSPPITLAVGTYKVTFWYHSSGATYPEKMEVKWGSIQSAAGMTNGPIFDNNNIISGTYAQGSGNMVVTAAGDYYVGWHGYSDADMYYITVDDINIDVALPHDVSTVSIDNIPAIYDPIPTIPKATVKNLGLNTETFTVTATITGGYSSTKTVTALAPDASVVVSFDTWTPTVGAFTANVCTNLGTDPNTSNNCKSTTGTVYNYTRFYSYIAYGGTSGLSEGPGFFYKEAPGTIVSLAATTSDQFISAGTWANGTWYGSEYYDPDLDSGGGWWTIDPTTGAMTKIADLGRSFTGITFDHTANIMYGVDYDDVALTNDLYSIVPTTGVATLIGSVGPSELLINLATDGSGFLYSLGISTDHLFKINPVGPVLTDVGTAGILMSYAQDMEYDYATNTMYAAAYLTASTSGLYTVNLTTGACTLAGAFAGDAELTGFAIPYTSDKTLNLTSVLFEGLYNGAGTLRQAMDETGNPHFTAPTADQITVELHNAANYATIAYTVPAPVYVSTSGTVSVSIPSTYGDSYYITIKHRNSVETTTATAVSFAGGIINQSFVVGNVYGGNLGLMIDGYYAIYAGDVNQDGAIDSGDFTPVDNDAFNYAAGYLATDVNGDGAIDSGDFTSIDNNGFNYIGTIHP